MELKRIVILEAASLGQDVDLTQFEKFGIVTKYDTTKPEEVALRLKEAEIAIVNKAPMTAETLSCASHLQLIALTATGVNNVDFSYTNAHGISVANVKGYSTASVVQHTFAMLFYLYEKLSYYDQYVKSGSYAKGELFSHFDRTFHELSGKRFGIIGLGTIGNQVAAVAQSFGCEVVYYSTTGKHTSEKYKRLSFEDLLCSSDIVSIHAPLTKATKGLIAKRELERMKPGAILLNTGRGAILDEEALAEALKNGHLAAAGLDVLEEEPMNPKNPLLNIQDSTKLLITPHIAWATIEARTRCASEVCKNIAAFIEGTPRNLVTGNE